MAEIATERLRRLIAPARGDNRPYSNGGSGKLNAELCWAYLAGAHNCLAFGEGKGSSVTPYLYLGATTEAAPDANEYRCRAHDLSTDLPPDPDEAIPAAVSSA